MFGQSLIAGKIVEEIAKACGASKEDAKAIRKTVVWYGDLDC
jgi:CRISPR/Cas system type I-B associated protein Csh2 (Cas7 group RAMP superfamily)